jgi:transposase-like protein
MPLPSMLTRYEINDIVYRYTSNKATQEQLALEYGISPVTVRRILAEKSLLTLKGYKTDKDEALLAYLKMRGLYDLSKLKATLNAKSKKQVRYSNNTQTQPCI